MEPAYYLNGHPLAQQVFDEVVSDLALLGPFQARATKSQIAFRRTRGFAYLWLPGQYLTHPDADVVLTIALGRHDRSPRFKQVAHPSVRHWMHHLEIQRVDDIDDQVRAWLSEAFERAG